MPSHPPQAASRYYWRCAWYNLPLIILWYLRTLHRLPLPCREHTPDFLNPEPSLLWPLCPEHLHSEALLNKLDLSFKIQPHSPPLLPTPSLLGNWPLSPSWYHHIPALPPAIRGRCPSVCMHSSMAPPPRNRLLASHHTMCVASWLCLSCFPNCKFQG